MLSTYPCQIVAKCLLILIGFEYQGKKEKMKVTVLKDGQSTDYFYAPEHFLALWESYTDMQASGEIQAFSIVR